jgi:hypothetical protein
LDLEAVEELVEAMRRLGVIYLKTPDGYELTLGLEPARYEEPQVVVEHDETLPQAPEKPSRLNPLLNHPAH